MSVAVAPRALETRPPGLLVTVAAALVPRWAFAAWVALAWATIDASAFRGLPSPVEAGGLLLVGLGALRLLSGDVVAQRTVERLALLALLVVLPATAAALLSPEGVGLPTVLVKDLGFLAAAALALRTLRDAEGAFTGLALVGVVLGTGAVLSVLVGPFWEFRLNDADVSAAVRATLTEPPRAAGPFGESNFFALSLAMLVPVALHVMARGGLGRLLGLTTLVAVVGGIFAAGSRGGLLAAAVGFAAALSWGVSARQLLPRLGLLAVVVALVALVLGPTFAQQTAGAGERTVGGRITENTIALAVWADHPLTGLGPGGYPLAYRDYARGIGDDPRILREPHSLVLQLLSEQGTAGLLAWLTAAGLLVAWTRRSGVLRTAAGRTLALGILVYLAGTVFLHDSQQRLLFLLVGMLVGLGAARPAPGRERRP